MLRNSFLQVHIFMFLHLTCPPEPQAVWAIKRLQQSVLRVMHLSNGQPCTAVVQAAAGMIACVITGSGRKGCHGG
jgi:hypothetical protein